jgi:hypothetical protein
MFNWFKKKKETVKEVPEEASIIPMKPMNYHPKIILAWVKAIEGDQQFLTWLTDNGYPELTISCSAIHLKDEARDWLMKNGYQHLMAMINAAEGSKKAQRWLLLNNLDMLHHIAMAVEDEKLSWIWLKENATQDIFILAQVIKKIKDKIEERHNDIHSFGRN